MQIGARTTLLPRSSRRGRFRREHLRHRRIGVGNKSTVGQLDGKNDQATVQIGAFNKAKTFQEDEGGKKSDNASFTGQFGFGNKSNVGQSVGINGKTTMPRRSSSAKTTRP